MYFDHLNYTLGDEDASVEASIMPDNCHTVAAICGSGSRILPLLKNNPTHIHCFDICDKQRAITKLRINLLRKYELNDYLGFMGYTKGHNDRNLSVLSSLQEYFSQEEYSYLEKLVKPGKPLIYQGRFESTLVKMSKVIRFIIGEKIDALFDCETIEEQRAFIKNSFPKKRWNLALLLLGNATALNYLLYKGEFPKKNIEGSEYRIYKNIFESLLDNQLAKSSFFLQMLFQGRLRFSEGFPVECDPDVYYAAKKGLESAKVSFYDDVFNPPPDAQYDFISLSDVPSFLPADIEAKYIEILNRHVTDGAYIVARGHMRVVEPDLCGYQVLDKHFTQDIESETTGLWKISVFRKSVT